MGNANFVSISSVHQTQPVGLTTNTAYLNYGGFAYSFVLDNTADHDVDGVVDEFDVDDDGDSLSDRDELQGIGFDPPTSTDPMEADTDHDGVDDSIERYAGTNPRDSASFLGITSIQQSEGQIIVKWQAREGETYRVARKRDAVSLAENAEFAGTITGSIGTGPWRQAEMSLIADSTNDCGYLFIQKIGNGE